MSPASPANFTGSSTRWQFVHAQELLYKQRTPLGFFSTAEGLEAGLVSRLQIAPFVWFVEPFDA